MIDLSNIFKQMQKESHTIHCLVSPLVANDLANVLLSLNQAPFMAEYYKEVYQVTQNSDGLLVNLGTLNENKLKGMEVALSSAKDNSIPITLDPVGASATDIRLEKSLYFLKNYPITVLKGNYSEIYSIYHQELSTRGVDSHILEKNETVEICKSLSTMYNTIVVATGKEDIISDGSDTLILKNGIDTLAKITGTGCIAGGLIAATTSFEKSIEATAVGLSILNIASELANKDNGTGTFKISLLDEISMISIEKINERIIYERL